MPFKMHISVIFEKAKPDAGNIRWLHWEEVRRMAVKVTKVPLQPDLLVIGHNLLCRACICRTLTYRVITCKGIRQTQLVVVKLGSPIPGCNKYRNQAL
jgi:hypothetical protein